MTIAFGLSQLHTFNKNLRSVEMKRRPTRTCLFVVGVFSCSKTKEECSSICIFSSWEAGYNRAVQFDIVPFQKRAKVL